MAQFEQARVSPAGPQTLGSQVSANPTPIGPNVSANPFSAVANVVLKGASVAGRIAQSEADKEYTRQVREQRDADRLRSEVDRAHSEARVAQTDLLAATLIPMEEDARLTGNFQPYLDKLTELKESPDYEPQVRTMLEKEHRLGVVRQAAYNKEQANLQAAQTKGWLDVNNDQLVQMYKDPDSDFQKKLGEIGSYSDQYEFVHSTMIEDTRKAMRSLGKSDDEVLKLLSDPAVSKQMIQAENQIMAHQVSLRAEANKYEAEFRRKTALVGAASAFMEGTIDVGHLTSIAHSAHPSLGPEELQLEVAKSVSARATSLVDATDSTQIVSVVGQLQKINDLKFQFPPGQAANSLQASLESAYTSAAIKTADYVNKQLPLGADRDRAFIHVTPPGSTGWTTPAQQGFVAAARFFGIATPDGAKNLDELTPNGPAQKKYLDQLKKSYSDLEQGAKIDSTKTATAASHRDSFLTGHSLNPSEGFKADPFLFATDAKSSADFLRHLTDAVNQMPADVLQQVGGSRQELIQAATSAFGPNGVDNKNPTMRALATLAGQTTGKAVTQNAMSGSTVASTVADGIAANNPVRQQYVIGLLSGMGGFGSPAVKEILGDTSAIPPRDLYALRNIMQQQSGQTSPLLRDDNLNARIEQLRVQYDQLDPYTRQNVDPKRPDMFVPVTDAIKADLKKVLKSSTGIDLPSDVPLPAPEQHVLSEYIAQGRLANPKADGATLAAQAVNKIKADGIKIISDNGGMVRFISDPLNHVPEWSPDIQLGLYPTKEEQVHVARVQARGSNMVARFLSGIGGPEPTDKEYVGASKMIDRIDEAKTSQTAAVSLMLDQWLGISDKDDARYVSEFKQHVGAKEGSTIREALESVVRKAQPQLFSDKSVDYSTIKWGVSFDKAGDEMLYPDGGGVIYLSVPTRSGIPVQAAIPISSDRHATFSQRNYSQAVQILSKRSK